MNPTSGPAPMLFSILPSLAALGPLGLLALVFPASAAVLAVVVRRWSAYLGLLSAASGVVIGNAILGASLPWNAASVPWLLPFLLILLAVAATCLAWRRRARPALASGELAALLVLGGVGLGVLGLDLVLDWGQVRWLAPVAASGLAGAALALAPATRSIPGLVQPAMTGAFALATLGASAVNMGPPMGGESGMTVAWVFDPGSKGAFHSTPVVKDGQVYVGMIQDGRAGLTGAIYCLDLATGSRRWVFQEGATLRPVYSTPCLDQGRLYIGAGLHADQSSRFYCLDAKTGKKLWSREVAGHVESSPCVHAGIVYFGAGEDGLYAVSAHDGGVLWRFPGPCHIDASPTVAGERVFVGSGPGAAGNHPEVYGLDAASGKLLWRIPCEWPAWGSPLAAQGKVLVGIGNGRLDRSAKPPEKPVGALLCLDAETGKRIWQLDTADAILAQPATYKDLAIVGSREGVLYALRMQDGHIVWRQKLGGPIVSRPVIVEGRLYQAVSNGTMFVLQPDSGTVDQSFSLARYAQMNARVYAAPALAADGARPGHRLLILGAELYNPVSSFAGLFCLRD